MKAQVKECISALRLSGVLCRADFVDLLPNGLILEAYSIYKRLEIERAEISEINPEFYFEFRWQRYYNAVEHI